MSEEDLMANRYDSVFVITDHRGVSRMTHHQDGTITGTHANGGAITGIWSIEDGKLWETFYSPPESAALGRHGGQRPFAEKKIGDKWEIVRPDGKLMKFELVNGD